MSSRPPNGRRSIAPVLTVALTVAATLPALLPTTPAIALPALTWRVDLSHAAAKDNNIDHGGYGARLHDPRSHPVHLDRGYGELLLASRHLAQPVGQVSASAVARVPRGGSVLVEVRGGTSAGGWTEWRQATAVPATLPAPTARVQVRVVLLAGDDGTSPVVSRLDLSGRPAATATVAPLAAPLSFSVFATREGLVGGQTANGHIITSRDHFVALPSTRGLSPRDAGDFTVRVCSSATGRCEYAPVWDVGPWNTTDDYWNPSSVRQRFTDLPQGLPEAEAAFLDGYNGGRDQFGRTVLNPAGIDLADGTFLDGVGLTDNAWVTVTYLWTGTSASVTGEVRTASGGPLTVRAGPHTTSGAVGLAANHARVTIECQTFGDTVSGVFGTSSLWDRIGPGNFVSDAFVSTGSNGPVAPSC